MLDQERDQPTISFPLRIHRYGSWEAMNSGDESDVFSPRLWNYNETLSPKSRIQAIARGQREMMEMVRNMPESSYELSLKDLVEKQRVVEDGKEIEIETETEEKNLIKKNNIVYRREGSSGSGRKLDQMSMAKRNGDVHSGGFYLKMMIPTSLGSKKKKKKNESSGNESSKVSLRSWGSEGCLRKSPSVSTMDSESGETTTCIKSGSTKSSGSSSSSSSSRSSSRRERRVGSCWFLTGKTKLLREEE